MSAPGTTPGPWEVQTPMGDNAPWIVRAGLQVHEWEPIATLGNAFEDLPPNSAAQKRITADANLIGASQALYDVVAAMAAFDGRNNNAALKAMARAALAQAEGKTV